MMKYKMNEGMETVNEVKRAWEPMKLTYSGDAGEIIKNAGGQGKTSVGYDPGDNHKPPGQG
jgi:hypothetical protein